MTAREMTAEELEKVREQCRWCADSEAASLRHLLDHVDSLTARLEAAERERDEARRLGLQHAMVASGHSHSLLRHEHQSKP